MRDKAFDIVIVGAGLFGSTCAYELTKKGFRCLVLEKRGHIGGNCYTECKDGIHVHSYGAHIFHTSHKPIWDWINQFAVFNHYHHRVKVNYEDKLFSFPINLDVFYQIWGVKTPEEARQRLSEITQKCAADAPLDQWIISQVGTEIYDIFIKGYTTKQWGRPPAQLPSSIIKRLPVRLTFDDNYYNDPYQGIPIGGYTAIFSQLLANCEVRLNTDYLANRQAYDQLGELTLYTGSLDAFFDYCYGNLEYRSMRFELERHDIPDYQGISVINYTSQHTPFTRIIEHKHFESGKQEVTWITREYPEAHRKGNDPMYPIGDAGNKQVYKRYQQLCAQPHYSRFHFGGRLAEYQYYDMHQVIGSALQKVRAIEEDLIKARDA